MTTNKIWLVLLCTVLSYFFFYFGVHIEKAKIEKNISDLKELNELNERQTQTIWLCCSTIAELVTEKLTLTTLLSERDVILSEQQT